MFLITDLKLCKYNDSWEIAQRIGLVKKYVIFNTELFQTVRK